MRYFDRPLKILCACEESQAVTIELRNLGEEAYSCDLEPCSGGHPEWHLQQDVTPLLEKYWDLIIAFPPCTYLTVTGNKWFNVEKFGDKAIQREKDREEAVQFFMSLAQYPGRFAIENPVGIMSTRWRKPDQIIQPWQFGDPFEKKTCIWLKGLPKLQPTNIIEPPKRTEFKSGKSIPTWYADAWKLPKDERAKIRSKTFPGIARAMAIQWSAHIHKERLKWIKNN